MTDIATLRVLIVVGLGALSILSAVASIRLTNRSDSAVQKRAWIPSRVWMADWLQGASTEMFGALVAALLFTFILDSAQQATEQAASRAERKAELIVAMGSPINNEAIAAVRQLHEFEWLEDESLVGKTFDNADLSRAPLSGANLAETSFRNAKLIQADLSGANLRYSNLTEADISGAELADAVLEHAILQNTNLGDVLFKNVNLTNADLQNASFGTSTLEGANLTCALLMYQRLIGISLKDATLRHANLENALLVDLDLQGINLEGANLMNANLTNVNFDNTTILPDGSAYTDADDNLSRFTDPDHPDFWHLDTAAETPCSS